MNDFKEAIEYVLENEQGYVNNPSDPGGATNFGISQKSYPDLNIQTLTREQALVIYKRDFWDHLKLEEVPQSFATAILDMSVNMGEGHAVLCVQMALGQTSCDGILGSNTLAQLKRADNFEFLYAFIGAIQDYYVNITVKNPKLLSELKGWIRRSTRLITLIETA